MLPATWMTKLYRCRTSLSEVAVQFAAATPECATWSAEVWPRRAGLIVRQKGSDRVAGPMIWGVPRERLISRAAGAEVTAVWFQELHRTQYEWLDPARRCLIVLDSFAYPEGSAGARKRAWFGIEDCAIFAWAGVWSETDQGGVYCGLLAAANELVAPGKAMPVLVDPGEYETWLGGDLIAASWIARRSYPAERMYGERLDEPWNGPPDY